MPFNNEGGELYNLKIINTIMFWSSIEYIVVVRSAFMLTQLNKGNN
jgi:hypothetical protein